MGWVRQASGPVDRGGLDAQQPGGAAACGPRAIRPASQPSPAASCSAPAEQASRPPNSSAVCAWSAFQRSEASCLRWVRGGWMRGPQGAWGERGECRCARRGARRGASPCGGCCACACASTAAEPLPASGSPPRPRPAPHLGHPRRHRVDVHGGDGGQPRLGALHLAPARRRGGRSGTALGLRAAAAGAAARAATQRGSTPRRVRYAAAAAAAARTCAPSTRRTTCLPPTQPASRKVAFTFCGRARWQSEVQLGAAPVGVMGLARGKQQAPGTASAAAAAAVPPVPKRARARACPCRVRNSNRMRLAVS